MNIDELRQRVYCLAERLSWLGVAADIPALTLVELEALHRYLQRLADG